MTFAITIATHRAISPRSKQMKSAGRYDLHDPGMRRFESLAPSFPIHRVPLIVEFDPPAALFESVQVVLG